MEDGWESPGRNCTSMGTGACVQVYFGYKEEGTKGVVCDPPRSEPEPSSTARSRVVTHGFWYFSRNTSKFSCSCVCASYGPVLGTSVNATDDIIHEALSGCPILRKIILSLPKKLNNLTHGALSHSPWGYIEGIRT